MSRGAAVAVAFALLGAGAWWLVASGGHGADGGGGASPGARFRSSADCRTCHEDVWNEWERSQHAIAFTNPLVRREDMADGFRKKDCIPCHAPRSVFEHGLGKAARVLARDADRVLGVDCLSCHGLENGVAATRPGLSAPCNPIFRPELRTTDLCAPCHNQHGTIDEWERSDPALRGENCSGCHMPGVERRGAGGPRRGAFHGSRGGNDPELLRRAARIAWELREEDPGPSLDVTVTNEAAAHDLPTDARHRAVDLVVTLLAADDRPLGPPVDLGPGQRGGHARTRFRNPYRDETGLTNTQLASGASHSLTLAVDRARAAGARIQLLYKRTPFLPDDEAFVMHDETITF